MFDYFIKTFPHFALYFGVAIALLTAFIAAYVVITPQREFELIRQGNAAASISLIGALMGFALGLNTVIRYSESIPDLALWGILVLLIQVATFWVVTHVKLPNLSKRIEQGDMAAGIYVGGFSLVVGILQNACMTP